jgi:hypothetical protein
VSRHNMYAKPLLNTLHVPGTLFDLTQFDMFFLVPILGKREVFLRNTSLFPDRNKKEKYISF